MLKIDDSGRFQLSGIVEWARSSCDPVTTRWPMSSEIKCDVDASKRAMSEHIRAHDLIVNEILHAIRNAINSDPNTAEEDKLLLIDPVAFRSALASAVTELLGWDLEGEVEPFIEELRAFCTHDDDLENWLL